MSIGLLGKKLGMTQVYNDKGEAVPVTVIDVTGNTILQVKTKAEGRLHRRAGRLSTTRRRSA